MSRNTTNLFLRSVGAAAFCFVTVLAVASAASAACGDTTLDDGEQCDDGNVANDDGCDSLCTFETSGDMAQEMKLFSVVIKDLSHGIDVGDAEEINTRLHGLAGAALVTVEAAVASGNLDPVEDTVDKNVSKILKLASKLDRIGKGVTSGKIQLSRAALDEISTSSTFCDDGVTVCASNVDCGGGACTSELAHFAAMITPAASQIYGTSNPDLCPPFDCSMAATQSRNDYGDGQSMDIVSSIDWSPMSIAPASGVATTAAEPSFESSNSDGPMASVLAFLAPSNPFVTEAEAKTLLPCVSPCQQPLSLACLKCLAQVAPQLKQCAVTYNSALNGCCTCKWNKPWCCACRTVATFAFSACVA